MPFNSSAALILIVACWTIAPALICERRLRAFKVRRAWGLIIGVILGPLGVAVINLYISLQCLSLMARTNKEQRLRAQALEWSEGRKFTMRGDMFTLACLWAAVLLGSIMFAVDNPGRGSAVATHQASQSQPSVMPGREAEAITVASPVSLTASSSPNDERLSLQALKQTTLPNAVAAGSGELARLSESQQAAPLPTVSVESNPNTTSTLPTSQPISNAIVQSAGTGEAVTPVIQPIKPIAAGARTGELIRLVVPSNLRAHGTISGMGGATTLTITCADCTYQLGVERLRAGSARATIKAAGVHIVVLINGQDTWTFML